MNGTQRMETFKNLKQHGILWEMICSSVENVENVLYYIFLVTSFWKE